MSGWLIVNARLANDGQVSDCDVRIGRDRITEIGSSLRARAGDTVFDARGNFLMPGMIDTQVNFREPGRGRRGNLASESRAAVAGGVTSYLDMPNASPPTTSHRALADKFSRAAGRSTANYSFFLAATEDNLDEIRAAGESEACGIKVTVAPVANDLQIRNPERLSDIFRHASLTVAAHCEDSDIIEANLARARASFTQRIPPGAHPGIRSREACLKACRQALELARDHGTRLHVLHISTAEEIELFEDGPVADKSITAEASLPHLFFIDADHESLGNRIKTSPSIKTSEDRRALRRGLKANRIDMISSDHAPHVLREKTGHYEAAAAGLPMVQFALPTAWSLVAGRLLSPEQLVEKIAHNPARRFGIVERGFVREGYFADLVLIDPNRRTEAHMQPNLSECGWTPFAGRKLPASVAATWVNGRLVWRDGLLTGLVPGEKLAFERER